VEQGKDQRLDVRSVDVRIGRDDDLVVSGFGQVEFIADAAAEGKNDVLDLIALERGRHIRALDVEDFAFER
jgi:hypothetical protein